MMISKNKCKIYLIALFSLLHVIIFINWQGDNSKIKKALLGKQILNIEPIKTGLSDSRIYKVFTKDNEVFIARFLSDKRDIKERKFEINLMLKTASEKISPKIIYNSLNHELVIMDYIDGTKFNHTFLGDPLLRSLAKNLKKIHSLSFDNSAVEISSLRTRFFVSSLVKEYKDFLDKFDEIERDFLDNSQKAIAHTDLHPGNLIADDKNVWIIDWQDAGIYGPLFDVARVSVELGLPLVPKEEEVFLFEYFDRNMTELEVVNYRKALALVIMKIIDSLIHDYTKDFSDEVRDEKIKTIFYEATHGDKINYPAKDLQKHIVFMLQKLYELNIGDLNLLHKG